MKKLAFGLMRLPLTDPSDNRSIDIERTKALCDEFLKNGFTYFDTAAPYHGGMSESTFRSAVVERYPRESYTVTDKLSLFAIPSKEDMIPFFEKQFTELGVDYIDYYLIHALDEKAYEKAKDFGAFEFVKTKKEEGKLRHIGFSFHDSAEILERIIIEQPEMEYVQLQINYLDWEDENVQSRKCYEVARKYNKKILIMEPVKGGSLANISEKARAILREANPEMSVASWAVRFAASLEGVEAVLSGMSTEEQMADNISYMQEFVPLSPEEMKMMEKAAKTIRTDIPIACTACRYCTDTCPAKIAIPDYFAIYNNYRRFDSTQKDRARRQTAALWEKGGKCSDCISCGICEEHCPQRLPIREFLKEISGELEE